MKKVVHDGIEMTYLTRTDVRRLIAVPPGMVLVHNSVYPVNGYGVRGSRAWLQRPSARLIECRCGWWRTGDPHYRVKERDVSDRLAECADQGAIFGSVRRLDELAARGEHVLGAVRADLERQCAELQRATEFVRRARAATEREIERRARTSRKMHLRAYREDE